MTSFRTSREIPATVEQVFAAFCDPERFLKNAKAEDIAVVISRFLSSRGSVVAYKPLNAVIIRDVAPPAQSLR